MSPPKVTLGPETKDATTERCTVYIDGKVIGYWYVDHVLQRKYGEFIANDYGRQLLGRNCMGGADYEVADRIAKLVGGIREY